MIIKLCLEKIRAYVRLSDGFAEREYVSDGTHFSSIAQASHHAWRQHRQRSASAIPDRSLQDTELGLSRQNQCSGASVEPERRVDLDRTRREKGHPEALQQHAIMLQDPVQTGEWSSPPTPDTSQKYAFRKTLIASLIKDWLGSHAIMSRDLESGLFHLESPESREVESAGDTFGLLQLGAQTGDVRVTQEAARRYAAVAAFVRRNLDSSADSSSRLATRSMLLLCDLYTQISAGHAAWSESLDHISSIIQAITAQGPPRSSVRIFFQQYRHWTLLHSLVSGRRAASEYVWQLCSEVAPQGRGEDVVRLALSVPGLIEDAEAISAHYRVAYDDTSFSEVRSRLLRIELYLVSYLVRHNSSDMGKMLIVVRTNSTFPSQVFRRRMQPTIFNSRHFTMPAVVCYAGFAFYLFDKL